jgi:hypothetical protein
VPRAGSQDTRAAKRRRLVACPRPRPTLAPMRATPLVVLTIAVAACATPLPSQSALTSSPTQTPRPLPYVLLSWSGSASDSSRTFTIDGHGAELLIEWHHVESLFGCGFLLRLHRDVPGEVPDVTAGEWGWSLSQAGPTATPRPSDGIERVLIDSIYTGNEYRYWVTVASCPEGTWAVTVTRER